MEVNAGDGVTYLRIKFVKSLDGSLDIPAMDAVLNLLPGADGGGILLWLQVCLFREPCSCIRVAFHGQIIQNQGINIAKILSIICTS